MDTFEWIEKELAPRECHSAEFIYDEMESQSGHSLPVIYFPFDASQRSHWGDRGATLDYLLSVEGEGKRLLDFGPGDGWPSLNVAPFAGEVVGIDGSLRRVSVCTANAARMGISNATFVHAPPGSPLPFPDGTFDGVMAAHSVEQTPDPKATLRELHRLLKLGGRLRIAYEALGTYRNGREREAHIIRRDAGACQLVLYNRRIDEEYAVMYRLTIASPYEEVAPRLGARGSQSFFETIDVPSPGSFHDRVTAARRCTLTHPSGTTLVLWLRDIGFGEVLPSHSGQHFAEDLFERLPENGRPQDMDGVDALLRPLVRTVVGMAAPLDTDPMITAVK